MITTNFLLFLLLHIHAYQYKTYMCDSCQEKHVTTNNKQIIVRNLPVPWDKRYLMKNRDNPFSLIFRYHKVSATPKWPAYVFSVAHNESSMSFCGNFFQGSPKYSHRTNRRHQKFAETLECSESSKKISSTNFSEMWLSEKRSFGHW